MATWWALLKPVHGNMVGFAQAWALLKPQQPWPMRCNDKDDATNRDAWRGRCVVMVAIVTMATIATMLTITTAETDRDDGARMMVTVMTAYKHPSRSYKPGMHVKGHNTEWLSLSSAMQGIQKQCCRSRPCAPSCHVVSLHTKI